MCQENHPHCIASFTCRALSCFSSFDSTAHLDPCQKRCRCVVQVFHDTYIYIILCIYIMYIYILCIYIYIYYVYIYIYYVYIYIYNWLPKKSTEKKKTFFSHRILLAIQIAKQTCRHVIGWTLTPYPTPMVVEMVPL